MPGTVQWHEGTRGQSRLHSDRAMVAAEFPSLKLVFTKNNDAALVGTIAVNIGKRHEITREAKVSIIFDNNYPNSEPDGFIEKGTFSPLPGKLFADRHMHKSGWCCLELPAESSWDPKDPDALRKWLTNFVFFVHRQFLYDINGGVWPGPEWEHGEKGWAQFVLEKMDSRLMTAFVDLLRGKHYRRGDICPCGSAKRFAQCHKRDLDQLLALLPNDTKRHRKIAEILEQSDLDDSEEEFEEAV